MTISRSIIWVAILAGGLSGLCFSIFLTFYLWPRKSPRKKNIPELFEIEIIRMWDKSHLFEFLKEPNALESAKLIGEGACGKVYLVTLPESPGTKFAVKKIKLPNNAKSLGTVEDSKCLDKKTRQIKHEIDTVGSIRHRNLLPLIGYVPRDDNCHFLVYPYMENGNLEEMIRSTSSGEKELRWPFRHEIAIGIAAGLEYIHTNTFPRILHRDLKPANILLDHNLVPKITDFGLSRAFPELEMFIETYNMAGTPGFIAPEHSERLMLSDKSDIYSFGVLLACLVTGKLPSDKFFQSTQEGTMVKWLRNVLNSYNPCAAIHPKLIGNGHEVAMLYVLRIALACTSYDPNRRPNSKELKTMLEALYYPAEPTLPTTKMLLSYTVHQNNQPSDKFKPR